MTAYLFASLRHAIGRCAARRQKDARLADCLKRSPPSASDLDPIARREFHQGLQAALERLPPEQREVVSFRLAGGLTFAQIAETQEVSTQTAASRYRYGLEKLRLLLKEHG